MPGGHAFQPLDIRGDRVTNRQLLRSPCRSRIHDRRCDCPAIDERSERRPTLTKEDESRQNSDKDRQREEPVPLATHQERRELLECQDETLGLEDAEYYRRELDGQVTRCVSGGRNELRIRVASDILRPPQQAPSRDSARGVAYAIKPPAPYS